MSTWITDVGDHIQDQIQEYTKAHDLAESYKNYDEEDGILSRDGKIFVLDNDNLQMEIVHLHHDTPLAGHPGQEKMLELLERSYFWLGMSMYVKNYVSRCDQCAHFKGSNVVPPGKLQPLDSTCPLNPYTIHCITTRQGISFAFPTLSHGYLLL